MQGIHSDADVVGLLPGQMGVLLTLQPPAASYIRVEVILSCFRPMLSLTFFSSLNRRELRQTLRSARQFIVC